MPRQNAAGSQDRQVDLLASKLSQDTLFDGSKSRMAEFNSTPPIADKNANLSSQVTDPEDV